jgi:hypothetical protein
MASIDQQNECIKVQIAQISVMGPWVSIQMGKIVVTVNAFVNTFRNK